MTMLNEKTRAVVALGMFDGVHIGHQQLIAETERLAQAESAVTAVYTFMNHPLTVLGGEPRLLTDAAARGRLLREYGAQDVEMVPFDPSLARCSPVQFIERLMARWQLAGLVAGYNYTFGDQASGTAATLCALGAQYGFRVLILPPVLFDGEAVSSTRIRLLLEQEGNVQAAAALLGRPYRLSGSVVANRQLGRRFGFPTANLAVPRDSVLPLSGVYATRAMVGGSCYPAVTNVGTNPTVHGDHLSIETHLIDFSGDLYAQELSVDFYARLRGEVCFASEQALIERIGQDVEAARAMLEKSL